MSALLPDQDAPLLYLYTGGHSIGLVLSPRPMYVGEKQGNQRFVSSAAEYAHTHRLDYVVLDRSRVPRSIGGEMEATPPGLRLVHETPGMSTFAADWRGARRMP